MPNHVTNILVVSGDGAQKQGMFEAIKNDEIGLGSLDFNKVIPMPENIFRGNLGQEERAKYGENNWYDWSIANWGTKWNSYGYDDHAPQEFDGSTITFQTAWSFAHPIIAALAGKYPDLDFAVKWAMAFITNRTTGSISLWGTGHRLLPFRVKPSGKYQRLPRPKIPLPQPKNPPSRITT